MRPRQRGGLSFVGLPRAPGCSQKRSASGRELLEPSLSELTIVRTPRGGKVRGRGGVWLLIRFGLSEKPPCRDGFQERALKSGVELEEECLFSS